MMHIHTTRHISYKKDIQRFLIVFYFLIFIFYDVISFKERKKDKLLKFIDIVFISDAASLCMFVCVLLLKMLNEAKIVLYGK